MKKLTIFLVALLSYLSVSAQSPLLDQWFLNNYLMNPAVTGIEQYMDVQVGSRFQWSGVDGAPTSHYFSAHSPLGNPRPVKGFSRTPKPGKRDEYNYKGFPSKAHHGIGAVIYRDQVGPFSSMETNVSYAYHMPLGKKLFLSAGASAGIFRQSLDVNEVSASVQMDPAIANFTPQNTLVLRPGLWLYGSKFYLGGAVSEFINSVDQVQLRTTTVTTGYRFDSQLEGIHFTPYGLIRLNAIENNYDVGLKVDWNRLAYIGGTYRSTGETVLYMGASLNFLVGFTYLYNVGSPESFTNGAGGTHEFQLNLRFRNKEKIPCPQMMW